MRIIPLLCFLAIVGSCPEASRAQCTVRESAESSSGEAFRAPSFDFEISVDKVSFKSIDADSVRFEIALGFIPNRSAGARQIMVSNLRLNDMPVYAAPITGTIRFDAGKRVDLPGPIVTTVYFRDLESLHPFEVLLSESRLRVQGTLFVDLDLNLIEKVALLTRTGRASLSFSREVPFEFPGGAAMREIVRRALAAASSALGTIEAGVQSTAALVSEWRGSLWQQEAPAALMGLTRFNLKDPRGRERSVECLSSGFRISDTDFLLPRSLVEPWRYDPELAVAVQHNHFTIDRKSYDLWVWPAGAKLREGEADLDSRQAQLLSRGQIRIVNQPSAEPESILSAQQGTRPRNLKLLKREGPTNLVLLEFTSRDGQVPVSRTPPPADPGKNGWDQIAVFRFPEGVGSDRVRPDLVLLSGRRQGTRITLGSMIDYSGWGAPLITPEGVVGIVQTESAAIPLDEALRAVKYVRR